MFKFYDIFHAQGKELVEFAEKAEEIRKKNHGDVLTYSKNVFIPVTNLCRNSCGYCGFRRDEREAMILKEKDVLKTIKEGTKHKCKEALFTFGERPEVHKKMRDFLRRRGYDSFLDYLNALCEKAIEAGLLPHTNAGILRKSELKSIKDVNASMGLMLENVSERFCDNGMPHEFSPGKDPKLRLRTIKNAGRLKIPFTTGLLIGIGETNEEIIESLLALEKLHERYGHIQEIIIQNFMPKPKTPMENHLPTSPDKIMKAVIAARLIFKDMNIQIPPNLSSDALPLILKAGANDLGGISPVTEDYINPEAQWPSLDGLKNNLKFLNLEIRERLAIYPRYIKEGWHSEKIGDLIIRYVDEKGLVRESRGHAGST